MKKIKHIVFGFLMVACLHAANAQPLPALKVSANHRYLMDEKGNPFFWLGDTGWLLFVKTNRDQAIQYLDDRKAKGFNVIQVMVLHDVKLGVNVYGDSALVNHDASKPKITPGNSFTDSTQYDFWDHVDFIIKEAERRGIYMALVPVWGSNVKDGKLVNIKQGTTLATFLANRYKNQSNIIWLNGGDIKGTDGLAVWEAIGKTLRTIDKSHLIGFHPRGRNSSSTWFHNESWLDFNMFQSGHRSYAQDTSANETLHYGEDNWRYVNDDYKLKPIKPTFDGEPSYEAIPYGLHDEKEPYWQDYEIRRYAYWSVFAGGCGFTYGHNAVMQFYTPKDPGTSYSPKEKWQDGMNAPGASQMQYIKKLMLSRPYFTRVPDQSMVIDNGEKYNRVLATRGSNYAFFYTYNGRSFKVALGKIKGGNVKASWFNPRNGNNEVIGTFPNKGSHTFDPPEEQKEGNDWVLVLEAS